MYTTENKKEAIEQFANKSPCICFNLRKAARVITQIYDNMFKEVGLTATQASILSSIRMIGPLTVNQLSDAMATDRTTITRNLKPLERDGYLKITVGQDRREKEIVMTQKGVDASIKIVGIWQNFQAKVEKAVGKERMENVCKEISCCLDEIQKA